MQRVAVSLVAIGEHVPEQERGTLMIQCGEWFATPCHTLQHLATLRNTLLLPTAKL